MLRSGRMSASPVVTPKRFKTSRDESRVDYTQILV